MNIRRPVKPRALDAGCAADVARDRCDLERVPCALRRRRAVSLWRVRRGRCDVRAGRLAFSHLRSRGERVARDYMRAVMALPAWIEWREAARREPWVLAARRSRLAGCARASERALSQVAVRARCSSGS